MCKNKPDDKLNHFLTKVVDHEALAQSLRRGAYLIALSFIRSDDKTNCMNKEWADDSFYFLNELAEALDPVLESE